jgi:hypothetical protein
MGSTWTDRGIVPLLGDPNFGDPVLARSAATGTVFLATLAGGANGINIYVPPTAVLPSPVFATAPPARILATPIKNGSPLTISLGLAMATSITFIEISADPTASF